MRILALQHELRPELPNIYGTLDYKEFRETLVKMDEILTKTKLEHYEKYFDEAKVGEQIRQWSSTLSCEEEATHIGLKKPLNFDNVFMDSTCIKANIHFPVDWVLLRDAARSLLAAIKTIRAQGLKNRMMEPQKQQVLNRIDSILEQLPKAIKQAHERIIGERSVASAEKILSLYDKDAHVLVRGKAGNEVEFGQGLILTEQENGLIMDWELFKEQPPSDSKLTKSVLERIEIYYGSSGSVCADRGFYSKQNSVMLEEKNIRNAICPKSPKELQEKLSDPIFVSLQTRRSQTEARIGIFKNVFSGKPLRSRITSNKCYAINWCALTHNLWLLSRMILADEQSCQQQAA